MSFLSDSPTAGNQETSTPIPPTPATNARYPAFPSAIAPEPGPPCASRLTNSIYFLEPASGRPAPNVTSIALDGLIGEHDEPPDTTSLACGDGAYVNNAGGSRPPTSNSLLPPTDCVVSATRTNRSSRNTTASSVFLAGNGEQSSQQPLNPFGDQPGANSQYSSPTWPSQQPDPDYERRARDRYGECDHLVSLPSMDDLDRAQTPAPHAATAQDLEEVMHAHQLMKIQQFVRSRQHCSAPDGRSLAVRRKKLWVVLVGFLVLCFVIGLTTWLVLKP